MRRLCPPRTETDLTRPAAADLMRVVAAGSVGWFHIWQQSWVGAGEWTFWARSGAYWKKKLEESLRREKDYLEGK